MKCFKTNKINKYFRVFTEIRKKTNNMHCFGSSIEFIEYIYIYMYMNKIFVISNYCTA